jgi:hypothetical protein
MKPTIGDNMLFDYQKDGIEEDSSGRAMRKQFRKLKTH